MPVIAGFLLLVFIWSDGLSKRDKIEFMGYLNF